ncbi:hypothetical protein L228DRAFT_248812 [Xylona heveae TC161]|uniref:Uncharacterized protein n=1 Tax=Xylona heveae (strain CBS 132557 / TC161) TaxID=1328760 RepID=A0A165FJM1_XYLHT|nr:hypothetical protein L228DRAFT_248812 [Xylona heveae TC161]KZF21053.1 hypothetical protein L228DRAFT_248812 [Xylona heveae TC161]
MLRILPLSKLVNNVNEPAPGQYVTLTDFVVQSFNTGKRALANLLPWVCFARSEQSCVVSRLDSR